MNIITAGTRKIVIPNFGPVVPARPIGGAAPAAAWYDPDGESLAVLGAYRAIGADSLAESYINESNPGTNDLVVAAANSAPTFDTADGWTFTASNALDTGIVPATSAVTVLVRFSNMAAGGRIVGYNESGCSMWIDPYNGNIRINYNSGGGQFVTPQLGAGVVGMAGRFGFRNGTKESSAMTDWTATPTLSIWIGKANGSFGGNYKIQAAAIYSTTLTDNQVAAVSTAMANLA